MTPALENNNPGNLRDPSTGGFQKFDSPQAGYAALMNDLQAKVTGATSTGLKPTSTLYDFSQKYAPSTDSNDPAAYTANLANTLGVRPDTKLSDLQSRIPEFAHAIALNEDKDFVSKYPLNLPKSNTDVTPTPTPTPAPIVPTQEQQAATETAAKTNPTFPLTPEDSTGTRALKSLGNIPGSIWNFAKGFAHVVNPVNTASELIDTAKAIPEIISTYKYRKQLGESPVADLGKDVAKSAYDNIVPLAGQELINAGGNAIKGNKDAALGNLEEMSNAIGNDPVGQILPFLMAAKGTAEGIDSIKNAPGKAAMADYVNNIAENTKNRVPIPSDLKTSNLGGAFDNGISTVASPITKPASYVFGKAADAIGNTAKFAASSLTGLDSSTLKTAAENPSLDLSKVNRTDLGQQIQSMIDKKVAEVEDTGAGYKPIRDAGTTITVTKADLGNMIKEATGLDLKKGKFETSSNATIRDAKDVRAVQNFYDTHQPVFDRGNMTSNEYLNMRADLGKLSRFDREISKSKELDNVSKTMYGKFNGKFRTQIPGLEELDNKFSPLKEELYSAKKGLVGPDGTLTDAGLTKLARVTENRPNLAAQLEKISPGFMERVKTLRAAEDLKAAAENHKVGNYSKTIGQGGLVAGVVTMNPYIIGASIAEMMLSNPENAIKLIQKYGKSKAVVQAAIESAKNNPMLKKVMQGVGTTKELKEATSKVGAFSPKNFQTV